MPPMPNFGRSDLLNARNLIAGGTALALVLAVWLGLRLLATDEPDSPPPPPEPTAEAPAPAPQPEPEPEAPKEAERPWPTLLVAAQEILAGDLLVPEAVDWRVWRQETDLQNTLAQDEVTLAQVLGAVAKQPIEAGAPILRSQIVRPGFPGYITAALAPGHRAVPVQVDEATANARIIHPGDHVDLTLVYAQGAGGIQSLAALGPVAQVIVSNVRVLAIGADLIRVRSGNRGDALNSEPPSPPSGNIYTLEVTPRDADRIALAATTGEIRLTLRSNLSLPEDLDQRRLVGLEDVMRPPSLPPSPQVQAAQVRIIRGAGRSDTVLVAAEEDRPSS